MGGGPSQFLIVAGIAQTTVNLFDVGLFAQDDWKLQSQHDSQPGPALGVANWHPRSFRFCPARGFCLGSQSQQERAAKTVLRAGFGIFYDRFAEDLLLEADRFNLTAPPNSSSSFPRRTFFPTIPTISNLSNYAVTPTPYEIDPNFQRPLHDPIRGEHRAAGFEKRHGFRDLSQFPRRSPTHHQRYQCPAARNLSVGRAANSVPALMGIRQGNIYDFQSGGLFNQNQLIANFNLRLEYQAHPRRLLHAQLRRRRHQRKSAAA